MSGMALAPRVADIVRVVSEDYGLPIFAILSPRKSAQIVEPRHVCVYLASELTKQSWTQLGRHFERDHTSLLTARANFEKRLATDSALAARVERLAAEARRLAVPEIREAEDEQRRLAAHTRRLEDAALRRAAREMKERRERTQVVLDELPRTPPGPSRDRLVAEAKGLDPRFNELARRYAYAQQATFTMAEREANAALSREIAFLPKRFAERARG